MRRSNARLGSHVTLEDLLLVDVGPDERLRMIVVVDRDCRCQILDYWVVDFCAEIDLIIRVGNT